MTMHRSKGLECDDVIIINLKDEALGFPSKIEQDLLKLIPKDYLKDINHLFVWHGRNTCIARKPKCDTCPINHLCEHFKSIQK